MSQLEGLAELGKVAGIPGIAIGVVVLVAGLILRPTLLSKLPPRESFWLIVILAFLAATVAVVAIWTHRQSSPSSPSPAAAPAKSEEMKRDPPEASQSQDARIVATSKCDQVRPVPVTFDSYGGRAEIPASPCAQTIQYQAVAGYKGTCPGTREAAEIRLNQKAIKLWGDTAFYMSKMEIYDQVEVPPGAAAVLSWVRTTSKCSDPVGTPTFTALAKESAPDPDREAAPAVPRAKQAKPTNAPTVRQSPPIVQNCTVSAGTNNGVINQDCSSK